MKTLISSDVRLLADLIRKGGVVVFPTETVYGIGASSTNEEACKRIYQIKGRPSDNPLIAHFDSIESIEKVCVVNDLAKRLLQEFSPGPLTLVLPKLDGSIFPKEISTLAVRIPKNPILRQWIEACGSPISAPSANLSGRPSLTRMTDVVRYFDGIVDGIFLALEPSIGIESTVVGMHLDPPVLLRPGSIESKDLRQFLPNLMVPDSFQVKGEAIPESPGMKYKHYAPKAKVILCQPAEFQSRFQKERDLSNHAWIGFSFPGMDLGKDGWESGLDHSERIKPVSSNQEYSSILYAFFEQCDVKGIDTIYCEEPALGEGREALLNRLEKASESK
ncbi:tRNA threonylcarbamoyl adenosine modification protein, Sua5/YciO/YrdC/YwlC family [Leptospira yanagawae serovar Saopaulo str. Sao Paulo = ATCC 700523]|uniref:Threonylcarbamoyl-AMP synthase n=1 Tax=Leptospira yanagawae serovar Saopaulo str. Sao Paulo = ATCC 700523 TaxID=1249483 RepID=A0A5E8HA30_9LEPT|nr:L-threonylcarbamoyladenylate synthase [Leptospira yanagawae]EOQ88024.1 tRNA threonylcarbamoyl adenosine modification protein, Sua5/YciO/YrdC/YwlC family [Leptospira yanagawae serovar Saopaulo str. Sao Paulo = ATCC 700523]